MRFELATLSPISVMTCLSSTTISFTYSVHDKLEDVDMLTTVSM